MTTNKLTEAAVRWAVSHLNHEGDTDLLPRPFEIDVFVGQVDKVVNLAKNVDVTNYRWQGVREFLAPKDDRSFRRVAQLDPFDALLFAAIVHEIGPQIEARRPPVSADCVFSYRFDSASSNSFFSDVSLWQKFWASSKAKAQKCSYVAVTDITDFYNQVYHHTIENQLGACGISTQLTTALLNLLKAATQRISRGIPVGPHASNLIAELALIPLDDYLSQKGYIYSRYVDDIHIFCASKEEAQVALYDVADFLDKNQKLLLSRFKTRIHAADAFVRLVQKTTEASALNEEESVIAKTVRHVISSPYGRVSFAAVPEPSRSAFSAKNIQAVLQAHLAEKVPNYTQLRWFLRRLTQVSAPGGIDFIVQNLSSFWPVISDAIKYINSAGASYTGDWAAVGEALLKATQAPLVVRSEYLQIAFYSLFSKIRELNHFPRLAAVYQNIHPYTRRKIILAARTANAGAWLATQKGTHNQLDPWSKRALIYASSILPRDERDFWLKQVKLNADSVGLILIDSL